MENIKIRKAERKDISRIYYMIKELAIFEKEKYAVKISEEELLEDGFGEKALYQSIVAEHQGKVIGFALYYIRYSTWQGKTVYLEDFLVEDKYRSQGVGKLLFNEMITISKGLKVRQMSWQVLDWNKDAIRFYKKYEANFYSEWLNGQLLFS